MPEQTRCGFVALIGAPNSGKSTLTNALVGTKVSIVTHKAQTTRGPVRGIALIGESQVILVDTPGIFQPKRRLDRAMAQAAWQRAGDADIVAVVLDSHRGLDEAVPPGPWLFPEDQLTDASLRQTAAEVTREKLFLRLHDELPYTLTVETTDWKELKDGSIRIEQTIYVERESQR